MQCMESSKSVLTVEMSRKMKGVGIILMFCHHFFTFPDFWTSSVSVAVNESIARWFCEPTNICVSIFAFITGYGFFFVKKPDIKYAMKKISDLLIVYWGIYLFLLVLVLLFGDAEVITPKYFLLECFGLNRTVMVFCWYLPFYIAAILWMTIAVKFTVDAKDAVIWMFIIPVIGGAVMSAITSNTIISGNIRRFMQFFPCVGIGYVYARYRIFDKVFEKIFKTLSRKVPRIFVASVLALGSFLIGHYWFSTNEIVVCTVWGVTITVKIMYSVFYCPVFIYATIKLLEIVHLKIVGETLLLLGKYSTNMWFIHCLFFNIVAEKTQPFLYFLHNPLLVLIWGLAMVLILAMIIEEPICKVLKIKNQAIFKQ